MGYNIISLYGNIYRNSRKRDSFSNQITTGIVVSSTKETEPMYFNNTEIIDKPVKIIGKVVELRRKF